MREIKNLRNTLWTSKFTDNDKQIFDDTKKKVEESGSIFKDLIVFCMENALEDINSQEFKTAAKELSLINELPVDEEDFEEWDEAWFYKNQISEYFDRNKNLDRAKKIISLIAKTQEEGDG